MVLELLPRCALRHREASLELTAIPLTKSDLLKQGKWTSRYLTQPEISDPNILHGFADKYDLRFLAP